MTSPQHILTELTGMQAGADPQPLAPSILDDSSREPDCPRRPIVYGGGAVVGHGDCPRAMPLFCFPHDRAKRCVHRRRAFIAEARGSFG